MSLALSVGFFTTELPEAPSQWRMDKQIGEYAHNGILLSNKKEQNSNACNNTDESQKRYESQKC